MPDRQIQRWRDARKAQHEAREEYRRAVRKLEAADAELVVAGAALAERLMLPGASSPAVMPLPFSRQGGAR